MTLNERQQIPQDVRQYLQIYQAQNQRYLKQIYEHIKVEKSRLEKKQNSQDISPRRLPPPIPPPMHILSWVNDECSKKNLTDSLNKFVHMSLDAPHSDTLHKTQIENYLTQMHEDYKITHA